MKDKPISSMTMRTRINRAILNRGWWLHRLLEFVAGKLASWLVRLEDRECDRLGSDTVDGIPFDQQVWHDWQELDYQACKDMDGHQYLQHIREVCDEDASREEEARKASIWPKH